MSEASADRTDDINGPAERLHPFYLITGLGRTLRSAWGFAVGGLVLISRGQLTLALGLLGAYLLFSVGTLFIKWMKLEYRVGQDELRIDSGFLNKTSRVIPFDRVTDIDIEQGPVHRLLGLARVRIETGATAAAKDDEGVLDTISLERAEGLREYVRARRRSIVAATPGVGEQQRSPEDALPVYVMSSRRVLIAGMFNMSLAFVAALVGVTQTLGDVIGFDPFKRSFWEGVFNQSGPIRDLIITHRIASAVAGAVLLVMVGLAAGIIRTVLREHGFRLERTETGLRRRRGLLTLTDVSIPVRRVQAAILGTGPVRRKFGWWELKLQSLAQDGGQGDHVVAPLARLDEAEAIDASINLPIEPSGAEWRPVARGFIWTAFPILIPTSLVAIIGFTLGQPWTLLALGVAAVTIALRIWNFRNTRYALDGTHLFIERGWWRHQRLILPIRKIQSIDLTESFWTRWFDYCALEFGVAGGRTTTVHGIPALTRVDAEALRAHLLRA